MTSPEETPEESPHDQPASATPPRSAGRRKGTPSRPWLVVSDSGQACFEEVGKHSIMQRTGIPAQDLRLLDPLLSYPSTILGRERAIVLNLEHIKAIITATEVLILNSKDPMVAPFVHDLQSRLSNLSGARHQVAEPRNKLLPFEFRVLEICLKSTYRRLEAEVRDELEHLLDDANDMAGMYLTKKLAHQNNGESSSRVEVDDDAFQLEEDRDYVDITEDCIKIMQDEKQNQLLEIVVMLSSTTVVATAGIVVVGIFGQNIHIELFDVPTYAQFWETTFGTIGGCVILYVLAFGLAKRSGLLR
ncbi:magnesium transporter MRS2-F [Cocos nucifera]|uniref:Magnesium transporter n=1 Tax=Cocos nucifera TaxID=13894 RepID=A0A8K0MVF4_COCNU|nr:magnesium transporter MRS2-F [Cocos nucifera]